MSEALPPPPNTVYESAINYNRLSPTSRAVMDLASRDENTEQHSIPEVFDASDLCDEAAMERLETEGVIAPLPKFVDKLAESKAHPEQFTHYYSYSFSALASPINQKFKHVLSTTPILTEAQALTDLDNFFDTVGEIASQEGDNDVADTVSIMRNELGYLDEADMSRGSDALANYWAKILDEEPGKTINVFSRSYNHKKSYEYVQERILDSLARTRPDLLERVKTSPEDWDKSPEATLVLVDDWVISGDSVTKSLVRFINQANELEVPTDNVEVHSIVIDSRANKFPGATYRSVFLHEVDALEQQTDPKDEDNRVASMLGTHGTVNYGFTWVLRDMQKYLQAHGDYISAPILACVEPVDYRSLYADTATAQEDPELIGRVVDENRRALELFAEIDALRQEVYLAESTKTGTVDFDGKRAGETPRSSDEQDKIDQIVNLEVELRKLAESRIELRRKVGLDINRI